MGTRWAIRADHAFDGVRFLPGGAAVVVEDDRIIGVETRAADLPVGMAVTEVAGTLLPGLFDCHVHLVSAGSMPGTPGSLEWAGSADLSAVDEVITDNLRAQAAAGVTSVRDLGDVDYRVLQHRDRQGEGLSRVVAAGPPITVPAGHCYFLGGVVDPEDPASLDRAVAERAERDVDLVKVMVSGGFLTPGSDQLGAQLEVEALRRLVDASHAAGLRIVAHSHSVTGVEVALEAGVDGLEHFTCLAEGGAGATPELLERIAASGATVDPTLGSDPARFPPDSAMPPPIREMLARIGITDRQEHFDLVGRNSLRLHEHGIRVVAGLDAGAMPAKPHGHIWRSVVEMVRGGWPLEAALATATSVAAEDCAIDAGRLAPGRLADLLVVDGDLAADVGVLGSTVAVWLGGARVAG